MAKRWLVLALKWSVAGIVTVILDGSEVLALEHRLPPFLSTIDRIDSRERIAPRDFKDSKMRLTNKQESPYLPLTHPQEGQSVSPLLEVEVAEVMEPVPNSYHRSADNPEPHAVEPDEPVVDQQELLVWEPIQAGDRKLEPYDFNGNPESHSSVEPDELVVNQQTLSVWEPIQVGDRELEPYDSTRATDLSLGEVTLHSVDLITQNSSTDNNNNSNSYTIDPSDSSSNQASSNGDETQTSPWRFEFQPFLFVPFSIDGDIVIGDNLEVDRAFYVDLLTGALANVLRNRVSGDRLENALENTLERIPLERLPNEISGELANELQLQLTERLQTRIEQRVRNTLNRFPRDLLPATVDFNLGLSDLLDLDLNELLWLAGRFELWYEDVGVFTQNSFSKIGFNSGNDLVSVDVDIELFTGAAGLAWRIGTISPGSASPSTTAPAYPALTVDVFGGVNYGDLTQTVDFSPGPEFKFDPDWFEPMIGGRFALGLSDEITVGVRAETSIGLRGGTSENWEVLVGLDWRLSENFSLRPAYRIYKISLSDEGNLGTTRLDLTAEGLWLGFAFNF